MTCSLPLLLATLLSLHLAPTDCGTLKDHLTNPQNIARTIAGSTEIGKKARRKGDWMIIVQLLVVGGILLFLGWLVHWFWKKYGKGRFEGTHECPLCLERIPDQAWTSGEHRRLCAGSLWEKLKTFPQHHNKKCPLCHHPLRLWPHQGEPFKCYNKNCINEGSGDGPIDENQRWYGRKNKRLVENNGDNRYSCYPCNVSYCLQCVNMVEAEQPVKPQRSLIKKFSSSKSSIKENKEKTGSVEEKELLPPPPSYQQAVKS